jgi:uncharacterized protein YuzE
MLITSEEGERNADQLRQRSRRSVHTAAGRDFQCRTIRVTGDIALDFAAGEKIVGIEVLGASHYFKKPEAPQNGTEALATPSGCIKGDSAQFR